jgi:hypothetical protein
MKRLEDTREENHQAQQKHAHAKEVKGHISRHIEQFRLDHDLILPPAQKLPYNERVSNRTSIF